MHELLGFFPYILPIFSASLFGGKSLGDSRLSKQGFISANGIEFPIIIDHNQVFNSFAAEGTALVIINTEEEKIVKYNFPLNRADFQKIREIILMN